MRILFLAHSHVSFAAGGAQQVADEMMRAAIERGHEVAMIAAIEPRDRLGFSWAGAPLVVAPNDPRLEAFVAEDFDEDSVSCPDWRAIGALRERIRRFRPDVVHFHHYLRLGVEALVAARRAAPDARISLTFHEMAAICVANGQMVKAPSRDLCASASPEACAACVPGRDPTFHALRTARLQEALSVCDHFVFPSHSLAGAYLDWGLPEAKCAVIQNGLAPLSAKKPPPPSPDANRFAFFGQLIDNKGLDVALTALVRLAEQRRVPARGIVFEIHGANPDFATPGYIASLAELAAQIEAKSGGRVRVVERGGYRREELAARMAGVDWVVAPSVWAEAFGLVVSEAWMFGRPVIVSEIGALAERVRDAVDGLTFPVGDSAALADAIASAAGDLALWRRLSEGILPQPTADDMLDAYEQMWAEPKS